MEEDEGTGWVVGGHRVPEEVVLAIASFLDPPSLAHFSLVCRAFHRLASDNSLWKGLCEHQMKSWPCHQAFIAIASDALMRSTSNQNACELWPRPFSWRSFLRCEALYPWPEDRFFLREQVGYGSFTTRYKALERETDRVVCIKSIGIEEVKHDFDVRMQMEVVVVTEEARRRQIFEEKEKLAARLMPITWECKSLPSIYGLLWRPGSDTLCLSRQYVPRSLVDQFSSTRTYDEPQIACILHDVLVALVHLELAGYGKDFANINLSLEKLLVSEEGHVMVNIDSLFKIVQMDMLPYYMAPEMLPNSVPEASDVPISPRCDIWALGLIAIRLATGESPAHPHPMRYIFHFGRYAPRELTGPYSDELKDLVYRCLERDPHLRPYPRDLLSHPFFEKRTTHPLFRSSDAVVYNLYSNLV